MKEIRHVFNKYGTEMKHFDVGSIIVIAITFLVFALALFFTGFTHDLLLEAGVFLIYVKLIMMAYNSSGHQNIFIVNFKK